ncbi:hypothetical protein ISM37_004518 [Salmonella enterica]|nr:hypothetical protein [Salmonella enterica]EGN7527261.1 hypothetical protein [Salmonella enterica]EGO6832881.1 hypothetical protein [Salmonella enterica]EGO6840268.1 hypothetical protein [Salmonella enterica]EGO6860197.1 hypothetical protein [Salmonella enterica]
MNDLSVNEQLWRDLQTPDDGAAAQEHLDAGFPIYYTEDDTPADLLVREHPDGRREWVKPVGKTDEVVKVLNP